MRVSVVVVVGRPVRRWVVAAQSRGAGVGGRSGDDAAVTGVSTVPGVVITLADLAERHLWPDDLGGPLLVVDLDSGPVTPAVIAAAGAIGGRTAVLVGLTRGTTDPGPLVPQLDILLAPAGVPGAVSGDPEELLASIAGAVELCPITAVCLVALLRQTEVLPPALGLQAESFAYSTLLAGPEHTRWLAARPARRPGNGEVQVERTGDRLDITLSDPERRNAFSRALRDGLVEALRLLDADDSITSTHLHGDGPAFCSGGDLAEFGTTPDPATAHLVRTTRSPALLLSRHRDRVEAHVHGACVGAGVELAAFAARVTATPDAVFRQPELSMGLVPGAGGTVSLTRRIGRHRTAYLALTGTLLDAPAALAWGLVDAVVP